MDAQGIDPPRMPYLKEGKIRILVYLSKEKVEGYEDIPNFEELYGIKFASTIGVWGPKGLPPYVLEKLDDAFSKGVKDTNFTAVLKRLSMPVVYLNREELTKYVMEVFPKVGEAIKQLKIEEAKVNK